MSRSLSIPLQFFAEPAGGTEPKPPAPEIDYEKLAGIVAGKQKVAEDTVLKNYFKQQGLSQEQVTQAINTYKEQQKTKTPDVDALQTQLSQSQEAARRAQVESAAMMEAVSLGVDPKVIPYLIRLADTSQAVDQDGKVDSEAVKNALNKVLEDVPALKAQPQQSSGFHIGASNEGNQNQANEDALKAAFGL